MYSSHLDFNQTILSFQEKVQRHSSWPTWLEFLFVFFMETVHVVGLVVLTFIALPQMDSVSKLDTCNGGNIQ